MASESIPNRPKAEWANDSEPIRVRGIIVKYLQCVGTDRPEQGNPRQSWILGSSNWIPDSLSWKLLGFRIPINSEIPDSLICIPHSKAQV